MGQGRLDDRNTIPSDIHTHNDSVCNVIPSPGYGAPWYRVSSNIKPLYEVVVMAGYGYGYKRVGSGSS